MDSILNSTKKYIGPDADVTAFDPDILMQINGAIMVLDQLGFSPSTPFIVTNANQTWDDYFATIDISGINEMNREIVKNFIYVSVKLGFDPPSSSFVLDSLRKQREEYEWRISVMPIKEEKKE